MKAKFSKLICVLCFFNLVTFAQSIPYGTTMESCKITDSVNDIYVDVYISRSEKNAINVYLQYNNITFFKARGIYIPNSSSFKLNRIYSIDGTDCIDSDWEVEYTFDSKQFFFTNKKKNLNIFSMQATLANESINYKNRYLIMKYTSNNKYAIVLIDDFLNTFK